MEMQTNPATIAMVMNDLAREEIHAMSKVEDHRYSKEVVQAVLAKDNTLPTIILEANLRAGTLTVLMAGEEINVPSLFNNGSGFFFRNDEGHEFLYIDHYAHQVVLNKSGYGQQKFETNAGWREGQRKLELDNIKQETAAARKDADALCDQLRRAMLLLATEMDDTMSTATREAVMELHDEVAPRLDAWAAQLQRDRSFV
jgi:hypothetical protein